MKCASIKLDGHSTNADIVEYLATKHRALFSSQTTTDARLNDIRHVIQDKVTCEGNAFVVTVNEVCGMTSKIENYQVRWFDRFVLGPLCVRTS